MNKEGLFTRRERKLFNTEKVADAVNRMLTVSVVLSRVGDTETTDDSDLSADRMLTVSVVLSCVGDTETTDDSDLSADRMSRYDSCL